jgi:hypothetical protein
MDTERETQVPAPERQACDFVSKAQPAADSECVKAPVWGVDGKLEWVGTEVFGAPSQ